MAKKIIIKGRKVVGGYAEGEAIVSKGPTMGLSNFKPQLGIITERDHPLKGISLKGKVFIFHTFFMLQLRPEPRPSVHRLYLKAGQMFERFHQAMVAFTTQALGL